MDIVKSKPQSIDGSKVRPVEAIAVSKKRDGMRSVRDRSGLLQELVGRNNYCGTIHHRIVAAKTFRLNSSIDHHRRRKVLVTNNGALVEIGRER
jgi:hypothetical protein